MDKIVASKIYENTVIPRIEYMGDSICAAVSDQGVIFYEGKEIPEETAMTEVTEEIQSVFFGANKVGLVLEGTGEGEENTRYEVRLYDASGAMVWNKGTNLAYSQIKMSGKDMILFNENECEIYNEKGVMRYTGSFDGSIADIYKGSGLRNYIFVFSDRTEEVKLK